ncbi:MAG: nucleotide pyrophosphatase/phosphodiesterase family protein [Chloroflexota bacterium]
MQKLTVINVVGLAKNLIGQHTPNIKAFMEKGAMATIEAAVPAVTTTAQSTYLTGTTPAEHGIVGNGWMFRDEMEIKFWRQSNKLVQRRKLWEHARDVAEERGEPFSVANMFWWYAMNSNADFTATPRPMYPSDGLKLPDVWTWPMDLRDELQADLGQFPLFEFWGPNSSIRSTAWIANAAMRVIEKFDPTLTLVYLPHLDYNLQRYGNDVEAVATDLQEIDPVVGKLLAFMEQHDRDVVILSEYGITSVDTPIHLNRLFREKGWISYRMEVGREMIDPGMSRAVAVADHQIAHIYVNDPTIMDEVRDLVASTPGVAELLDRDGQRKYGMDHERAGEFVALAEPNAWFTYYFWLDDSKAPDYARTVDIHRKPGYDPVELFFNPELANPKVHAAFKVLKKKLGFRYLMDVIGLDATLVKGSHGVRTAPEDGPLIITKKPNGLNASHIDATDVYDVLANHLGITQPDDEAVPAL